MANFEPLKKLEAPSTSRARAELTLADNFKKMIGGRIPDMINLPASAIDLFHINKKETTYSEATKATTDVRANMFDLIEGVPTYGVPTRREVQDGSKDDRKLALKIEQEGQMLIPYCDVTPVVMDHFYAYSFADIDDHLFVITKVEKQFLIDRDFHLVTYSPSPYFKYSDIMKQVVNTYVFEEDKGTGANGTGVEASQIVAKGDKVSKDEVENKIKELNDKFIDTFYNEERDSLIFLPSSSLSTLVPKEIDGVNLDPSWLELYKIRKMGFIYYSLIDLQLNYPIMEYSIDRNILFLEPPYPLYGAKSSYKGSLYDRLIRKDFKKIGVVSDKKNLFKNRKEIEEEVIGNPSAYAFKYFCKVRDRLNYEYELNDYEVKYDYSCWFYFKMYKKHNALTRYWNTGIAVNYLLHNTYIEDDYEKTGVAKYTLTHNIATKFMDMYMDGDTKGIVDNLYLLDYYIFDRENIDDYIGVPLVILVLKLTLGDLKAGRKLFKEGS